MKIRYSRVSTSSQSQERQIIRQHPDEVLYFDVVSGSVPFAKREKGKQLVDEIEKGRVNQLSVSSIDRLGRGLMDILSTVEYCTSKGVNIKVDNLGIESIIQGKENQIFKLIISVLGNIAEIERSSILERINEGVAIAKAKGLYKGRVKGSVQTDDQILAKYKDVVKHLNRKQSLRNTAKLANVSLNTVQRVKSIMKKNEKVYS